jgi:hypothetical protein
MSGKHPNKIMKSIVSVLCAICLLTGCNSGSKKQAEALQAKQMAIDSMKGVIAKKALIDSMNEVMAQQEEEMKAKHDEEIAAMHKNENKQTLAATPAKKKKKWNNTAKGAVIGAGTGAIAGALIDKKHVEGALVGSVVGAGIGTATGVVIDGSKKKKRNGAN